ncbi:hypothetical protein GCM10022419_028130 [Nonomuraea rosea]|uniref:Response regulatory domain-containing protein n=2 Tax=Nonomuraea rosea TaxID=638574 RepID=A0ABP6W9H6_9ACTN
MTVRVVIADDHPIVRDGLAALLSTLPDIDVAGVAANGRQAVRAAVTLAPDVLVLDIQMPDMTGIEAAREVAVAAPGVAVLMLTMFDDDESVFRPCGPGRRGTCSRARTRVRSSGPSTPWPPVRPSSGPGWPAVSSAI